MTKRRDPDRMEDLYELERQLRAMEQRYKALQEAQGLAVAPSPISMRLVEYAASALERFRTGAVQSLDTAFNIYLEGAPKQPVDTEFMEGVSHAITQVEQETGSWTWEHVCEKLDTERPADDPISIDYTRRKFQAHLAEWLAPKIGPKLAAELTAQIDRKAGPADTK